MSSIAIYATAKRNEEWLQCLGLGLGSTRGIKELSSKWNLQRGKELDFEEKGRQKIFTS